MRMEVRCCCQPQKLLGTVEVPDGTKSREFVPFTLRPEWWLGDMPPDVPEAKVRLQCLYYYPRGGEEPYLAIKSEEYGLEVLNRIPTFEELHESLTKQMNL